MQIKYYKGCYSELVTIGGKPLEDCSKEEIIEALSNMLKAETLTKKQVIEIIQIFGEHQDQTECAQCGDYNYEVIWK